MSKQELIDYQDRYEADLAHMRRIAKTCHGLTPSAVPETLKPWLGGAEVQASVRVGIDPDHAPSEYLDSGLFED